jgi:hypothetical protein
MFGWFLAAPAMATRRFGSLLWFGILCVIFAEAPRLILPLGFVSQPRLGDESLLAPVGSIFLIGSLVFGTPVFRIGGFTKPNRVEPLRTDGLYAVVRHPHFLLGDRGRGRGIGSRVRQRVPRLSTSSSSSYPLRQKALGGKRAAQFWLIATTADGAGFLFRRRGLVAERA